ncbi:class I SAM-dependent methyltransferase [Gemmatimonadota bacterium]
MKKTDNYNLLAPYYDIFINWDARLKTEIPFILQSCSGFDKDARALDIGCGTGYHLRAFQQAGFTVQGTEPSEMLRRQAERNLPGVLISPVKMEQLDDFARTYGPWNLVTCLGNTLPHLHERFLPEFFRNLFLALGQNSVAVIHILGYEKILAQRLERLPVKTIQDTKDTYRFERSYEYRKDHLIFSIEVWKNDELMGVDREIIYPLTAPSIMDAASEAGFRDIRFYGAFDHQVGYGPECDNLVAVLRKNDP